MHSRDRTHQHRGSSGWLKDGDGADSVQTTRGHPKTCLVVTRLEKNSSRGAIYLNYLTGLFYIMREVISRNSMLVKSYIWIPANYNSHA